MDGRARHDGPTMDVRSGTGVALRRNEATSRPSATKDRQDGSGDEDADARERADEERGEQQGRDQRIHRRMVPRVASGVHGAFALSRRLVRRSPEDSVRTAARPTRLVPRAVQREDAAAQEDRHVDRQDADDDRYRVHAATVARRRPRRQMTIGSVDGTSDGSVVD